MLFLSRRRFLSAGDGKVSGSYKFNGWRNDHVLFVISSIEKVIGKHTVQQETRSTTKIWWTSLSTSFALFKTTNFHSLMPLLDFHLHIYFLRNFLMYFSNSSDSLSFARCFQFNKLFFSFILVRHLVSSMRFAWKSPKYIKKSPKSTGWCHDFIIITFLHFLCCYIFHMISFSIDYN